MAEFTRYSNIDEATRQQIVEHYEQQIRMGCAVGQAVSATAHDVFRLTDKQWNGKIGGDAFAAVLATLVMQGSLLVQPAEEVANGWNVWRFCGTEESGPICREKNLWHDGGAVRFSLGQARAYCERKSDNESLEWKRWSRDGREEWYAHDAVGRWEIRLADTFVVPDERLSARYHAREMREARMQ